MAERASAMVSRPPRATVRDYAILFSHLDPARKRRTVPGGQEHERKDKPSMAPLPLIHREDCVAKIENEIWSFSVGPACSGTAAPSLYCGAPARFLKCLERSNQTLHTVFCALWPPELDRSIG